MQRKYKVVFRGDSRPPHNIFKNGLHRREKKSIEEAPICYKRDIDNLDEKKRSNGETNTESGVSVSGRISAATCFPFNDDEENNVTWIYIVLVDVSQANQDHIFNSKLSFFHGNEKVTNESASSFVNVKGRQVLDAMSSEREPKKEGVYKLLFADEIVVTEILPADILFAVQCEREFVDPEDLLSGGHYNLFGDIFSQDLKVINPDIPREMIQQLKEWLQVEIQRSTKDPFSESMPTDSGYTIDEKAKNKNHRNIIEIPPLPPLPSTPPTPLISPSIPLPAIPTEEFKLEEAKSTGSFGR